MKPMITLALALVALPLAAAPRITNGTLQTFPSLAQAISAAGTGWVGFAIPAARAVHITCCGDSVTVRGDERGDLRPAEDSTVYVFARDEDGRVERLRVDSPSCELDAGGATVRWADSVAPAESLAFLRKVVDDGSRRAVNGALLALSLHAGADETLIRIAHDHPDAHVRGTALFWLSQQAGEKAAAALRDAVDNDPEESVRAKAVFGISLLPDDQSVPILIDLLKHNASREVRRKAAFWLGQKKDPRALQAIEDILRQ